MFVRSLLFLFFCSLLSNVSGIRTLLFQGSNIPSADSRAYRILKPFPDKEYLGNLTVALWFKLKFHRDATYAISYATSDRDNNELNLGIRDNFVFIVVGEKTLYSSRDVHCRPDAWYHFCLVANAATERYYLYINGELNNEGSLPTRHIHLNGSLVLGQETDSFNGSFNDMQSYSGHLADFKLFSKALSPSEVSDLTHCNRSLHLMGDIANLEPLEDWTLVGEVEAVEEDFSEICKRDMSELEVFPDPFKFREADAFCRKLKGSIMTPLTSDMNERTYDLMLPYVDRCKPKNHASSFMWLGVTDKGKEGHWTDLEGNPLNFTNFNSQGISNSQDCAAFEKPPETYYWNDVPCTNTYNFCVSCYSQNRTVYRMRGLCEEKDRSTWFIMNRTIVDFKHSFRGYSKYNLQLNYDEEIDRSYWALIDMWQDQKEMLKWYTHNNAYPFGVRNWTVIQDYLLCDKPINSNLLLSFSACYHNEFTCNEGTCINLLKRCDLRADCPDASDEIGCDKIVMPPEYISSLPPPGLKGEPLGVNISVDIRSFSEIDILNMKIKVDLSVTLAWLESRLKYKNLRAIQDINYVDAQLVWYPQFDLLNADFPLVHKTPESITVKRSRSPEEDDPSLPIHDEIFRGEDNPLELSQKVNAPFTCDMDLRNFPFDIQFCKLLFQMSSVREDFAKWENVVVTYHGERLLTQYEVGTLRTGIKVVDLHSVAVIQVPLFGRFWFYVTSSYLPILMLIIIGYASLFCRHESSDLRIMMALTALLVLYALYQQISDGLPQTSYTKAVDIWCFFAITLIFSQVIFHVAIDIPMWPRSCMRRGSIAGTKDVEETSVTSRRPDGEKLLYGARIGYVLLFLLFFVVYWSVVLTNKSSSERKNLML